MSCNGGSCAGPARLRTGRSTPRRGGVLDQDRHAVRTEPRPDLPGTGARALTRLAAAERRRESRRPPQPSVGSDDRARGSAGEAARRRNLVARTPQRGDGRGAGARQ
ncbi:hypothetical protein ACRAWD_28500 [Caulobacter segnis]